MSINWDGPGEDEVADEALREAGIDPGELLYDDDEFWEEQQEEGFDYDA